MSHGEGEREKREDHKEGLRPPSRSGVRQVGMGARVCTMPMQRKRVEVWRAREGAKKKGEPKGKEITKQCRGEEGGGQ